MNIDYPGTDIIDQQQAKYLYENVCAILVVENMPVGSEIGIDLMTCRVGEKFKGIKLIPPGLHFIYGSACPAKLNTSDSIINGPRSGFFHHFGCQELLVKRWSPESEEFDEDPPEEEVQERYRTKFRELDQYLGSYRYSTYKIYLNLTNKLTNDIVDVLNPHCKRIRSVPYLIREEQKKYDQVTSICENNKPTATEDSLLSDLKPHRSTIINFTKLPQDHKELDKVLCPSKITEYNLDASIRLEYLLKVSSFGFDQILAEFQFAFITFLLCQVYESFEHWKQLLNIFCTVDMDLKKYIKSYKEFLDIVRYQVEQVPADLFVDIADADNLIRTRLDTLFQNIDELGDADLCEDNHDLIISASRLKSHLQQKFDWEFGVEREDEQPVIVDL